MHYYSHNIADYRKDTAHLTLLEHGIYRQLLDTYYLDENPIETQQVSRRLAIKSEEEQKALKNVLCDFFTPSECGNFYSKKRCDEEIGRYHKRCETAKANGSKGGRGNKAKKTQQVSTGLAKKSQPKTNQEPITNNQYKDKKKKTLKTFLSDCEACEVDPIPEDHIVFENAKKIGIAYDMVLVAWFKFKDSYLNDKPSKVYVDWRSVFNRSVKENWYKLWWADGNGVVAWTSSGQQAKALYGGSRG